MFNEYGIQIPTSYAELEGVCAKLKENGKYCASFGGKFGWHTMRLVDYFLEDSCGPDVHDALNARTQSWDQTCVVAAFAGAGLPDRGAERRAHADVSRRRRDGL